MDLRIKGKRALVFGSSSGIGLAIAKVLAAEGARVCLSARHESTLKDAVQSSGAETYVVCDLNKTGSARLAVEAAQGKLGGVDILVANAGGPPKGTFEELSEGQWQAGFQSLWMSVVDSVQAVLPSMKQQRWGRILLITSVAAKEPLPGLTVSNGLRAGLLGLAKSLSFEIASYGVTVNALLPGYTRTERLQELGIPEDKIVAHVPAKRLGEPWELASLTAFLASDLAGYVTGQAIACDGGTIRANQ